MGKFVIKAANNGQYYFNLKAPATVRLQVPTPEMYESASGRDNGTASVKSNATGLLSGGLF